MARHAYRVSLVMRKKRARTRRRPYVAAAFRVDASHRLGRVLAAGASLVLAGSVLSAAGMLVAHGRGPLGAVPPAARHLASPTDALGHALPTSWLELWPGIVGLALVAAGALSAILGLRRVLDEEAYLALRSDGALFVRGGERRLVRWGDVEDVRAERGHVVLVGHDGTATEIDAVYSGRPIEDVVRVARDVRRKALFGLLR